MSVDLSGLKRFNETLSVCRENIRSTKKNPKIERIINIAKEEITKAYTGKLNVKVIVEKYDGGFTIYAIDTNSRNPMIAFDEFGTGFYARGSYPGKLPTQKITFTSSGKKKSTEGWVYYYDNPYDKSVKNPSPAKVRHGGIYGWVTPNGVFHIGNVANATMYKACKKIIARVRSEVL